MKKMVAVFLCIILTLGLGGCGKGDSDSSSVKKGRYMERTIELPKEVTSKGLIGISYDLSGKLEIFATEGKGRKEIPYIYTKTEDGFDKQEYQGLEEYIKKDFYVADARYGEDGKWYVHLTLDAYQKKDGSIITETELMGGDNRTFDASEYDTLVEKTKDYNTWGEEKLVCEGKDVTPSSWKPGLKKDDKGYVLDYVYIADYEVTKDAKIIYCNDSTGEIKVCDSATKSEETIATAPNQAPWTYGNGKLYVSSSDSNSIGSKGKITTYDINNRKEESSVEAAIGIEEKDNCIFCTDTNETVFAMNKDGSYQWKKGGTMIEELFQGSQFSFGSTLYTMSDAVINPNKEGVIDVLASETTQGDYSIFEYYYDAKANASPTKKLTIYSLYDSATMKEAVHRYELKYPDVDVEFSVANIEDTSEADVLSQLNTQILSGKGADLILTDGLPENAYEEKGILSDLSDVIKANELASNIQNAYVKNGKLFSVPIKIVVPMAASTEDETDHMDTLDALSSYCESLKDPVITQETKEQLVEKLFYLYGTDCVSDEGVLNQEKLKEFLTQVKVIANQTEQGEQESSSENINCRADSLFAQNIYTVTNILGGGLKGNTVLLTNKGVPDTGKNIVMNQKAKVQYKVLNNRYIASGTVAVNSNSKNEKEAKKFASFLLSDEIQKLDCQDGYPVTTSAQDDWFSNYIGKGDGIGFMGNDGKTIVYLVPQADDTVRAKAKSIVEEATTPIYQDTSLISIIKEQSQNYLSGSGTVEDAVNAIMQKGNRYLEEQK